MWNQRYFKFLSLALLSLQVLFVGCTPSAATTQPTISIEYQNTEYGFSFSLPVSWKGYSIITDTWRGYNNGNSNITVEQGPIISIRHPLWTSENLYQDIPMMEIATFILILCLVLILTVYNRRQAHALEYMARLEEDRAAREIQDRRERKAGELHVETLAWLEKMVNPLLDAPLALTDTAKRIVPNVAAAELRSSNGRRLPVSTQPLSDMRRYDRQVRRANGKGAPTRLWFYILPA
jgi:hypothetical protein